MQPIRAKCFIGTLTLSAVGCVLALLAILTAPAAAQQELSVADIAVCQQVLERQPVGVGSVFSTAVGRLYCFTRVVGAAENTRIVHRWLLNGSLKASVSLPVKSASWRTWSYKTIRESDAGDWTVEVVAADGRHLDSILFFVE